MEKEEIDFIKQGTQYGSLYCEDCSDEFMYEYLEDDFVKGYIIIECPWCQRAFTIKRLKASAKSRGTKE